MDWGAEWLKEGFYGTLGQSRTELLDEVDTLGGKMAYISKNPSTVGVKGKVKSISQRLLELGTLFNVSPLANPKVTVKRKNGFQRKCEKLES